MSRSPAPRDAFTGQLQSRFRHVEGCDPSDTKSFWRSKHPDTNWVCSSAHALKLGFTYDTLRNILAENPDIIHCHKEALMGDASNVLVRLLLSNVTSVAAGIRVYKEAVLEEQRSRARNLLHHRI